MSPWIATKYAGAAASLLLGLAVHAGFGQESDPPPPANRPNREALRERGRQLIPEDREKMLREFRERNGLSATNRAELERRREEWKRLPPEERQAKMREFRDSVGPARREFRMSQQQRELKRKEIKVRVDAQIKELQEKQATGPLSPPEERRLNRMREMSKRLGQERPGSLDQPRPPADDPLPPPPKLEPAPSAPTDQSTPKKDPQP